MGDEVTSVLLFDLAALFATEACALGDDDEKARLLDDADEMIARAIGMRGEGAAKAA